jgi:uncharacterized protein HemY
MEQSYYNPFPMQSIDSLLAMILKYPKDELLHYTLGRAYAQERRWSEAVDAFRKTISLKADYTTAYRELGRALEQSGQLTDALAIYKEGLSVAEKTGDLQVKKELNVFIQRLAATPPSE